MKYLHTMVRVTDLEASLRFYRDALGLDVLSVREVPQGRFTLAFLAAPGDRSAPIVLEAADGTAFLLASVDPPVVADAPKQPTTRAEVHLDWDAWHHAGRPITVTITTDHPKAPPFRLVIKRPLLPAGTPPAPGAPAKPAPPAHDDPDPDAMPGP